MDEASAFEDRNGKDTAQEVYNTLRTSASTRFSWMRWMGIIISFPRKQEGDVTFKKYLESRDNPNIYGDRAATWEVAPQWDPTHPYYNPASDEFVVIEDLNVRVPK